MQEAQAHCRSTISSSGRHWDEVYETMTGVLAML